MYNTKIPAKADLPSSRQLFRSTVIAATIAAAGLVTIVMPSEYGVDPTGIGGMLGLTAMGQIKTSLAAEAQAAEVPATQSLTAAVDNTEQLSRIEARVASMEASLKDFLDANSVAVAAPAAADSKTERVVEDVIRVPERNEMKAAELAEADTTIQPLETKAIPNTRSDEMEINIPPGQGVEVKLLMKDGQKASYTWTANGGLLNYDTHGEGPGDNKVSYDKGRMVADDKGVIEAAFDGKHGWFWRNRTETEVTMTLKTNGAYSDIVRVK